MTNRTVSRFSGECKPAGDRTRPTHHLLEVACLLSLPARVLQSRCHPLTPSLANEAVCGCCLMVLA
jgi:hypothetical protein